MDRVRARALLLSVVLLVVTGATPAMADATRRAEILVGEFTGLRADEHPARATVLDRQNWVQANVASFRRTLEPFTSRVAERMAKSALAPAGRTVAGAEMGVLLGF